MTHSCNRALRDLLARARGALETPGGLDDAARAALVEDLAAAGAKSEGIDGGSVEVALIDSGDGTRFYVAASAAALTRELAAWCRSRWDRTNDARDPATLSDDAVADVYFSGDIAEYFAIGTARVTTDEVPIEQGRYCVLSTAHLSHATSEWLERWSIGPPPPAPIPIASTFYGWFVATREPDVPTEQIPDDLRAAMCFAREHGFGQILFDCDASVVEGLDVHNW